MVLGVGFAVGGITQLIAGLIQFRTGDTFHGVLFSTFGAFWVALYYYLQFYSKEVPKAQAGHALALMLIAFGVVAAVLLAASFRTSLVTVLGISLLTATLFVLAAGNYSASATTGQGRRVDGHRAGGHRLLPRPRHGGPSVVRTGRSCGSDTSPRSRPRIPRQAAQSAQPRL